MKTLAPSDLSLFTKANTAVQFAAHHREQVLAHLVEVYELNQGDKIQPDGTIVPREQTVADGVDQLLRHDDEPSNDDGPARAPRRPRTGRE